MIRDAKVIAKIREDCLNDKLIAELTRQKIDIMNHGKYYMVISIDGKEVLKHGVDELSQSLIDKIDLEIENIIEGYRKMLD